MKKKFYNLINTFPLAYGPQQIAKKLTADKILIPTAYSSMKGYTNVKAPKDTTFWWGSTVVHILERMEYTGHTVNFKTSKKSYKNKKKVDNPRSEWQIFENTHPAIISQHDFDLVQELRKNKRRLQKHQLCQAQRRLFSAFYPYLCS